VSDKKDTEKAPKMYEFGMSTQGLGRGPWEIGDISRDQKNKSSPETRRRGEKQESEGAEHRRECLRDGILHRGRGFLYPCKPKAGLHGAQAAVHSSSYRNNAEEQQGSDTGRSAYGIKVTTQE